MWAGERQIRVQQWAQPFHLRAAQGDTADDRSKGVADKGQPRARLHESLHSHEVKYLLRQIPPKGFERPNGSVLFVHSGVEKSGLVFVGLQIVKCLSLLLGLLFSYFAFVRVAFSVVFIIL